MSGAALGRYLPRVHVPWVPLGTWPTPLAPLEVLGRPIWVKHEGASSTAYGGNKIRTLEAWLGEAQARGAHRIWAIGATGSNHAVATARHARGLGIATGAIVFPQPDSLWALENAASLAASGCEIVRLRSVVEVPFAALAVARRDRGSIVMPPGGATPVGTFGAVGAAFELAEQIAAGLAPAPRRIVIPVGSTCTTAGLLAGLHVAHAIGLWRWPLPVVHGVRVTPWPVTSHVRTAHLAARTLDRLADLGGPRVAVSLGELLARLVIDRRELGPGYGQQTPASRAALALISQSPGAPRLDGVYSAKAAAALLRLHRRNVGPLLFWATKSAV